MDAEYVNKESNVGSCPKCGANEWESHIVQVNNGDGVICVICKWAICLPWGIYSLVNNRNQTQVVKVCKKCGFQK